MRPARPPIVVVTLKGGAVGIALSACASLAACTPAPVETFEAFYAATAARDAPAFRALLCPHARGAVSGVSDAELAAGLQVSRGLRRVNVKSERTDAAVLDVEDATGQHQEVTLTRDAGAPQGWCVSGDALAGATSAPSPAGAPQVAP